MNSDQLKDTPLADVTMRELQALIQEETGNILYEFMEDFAQYVPDLDEGWEVKPDVYRKLHAFLKEKHEAINRSSAESKPKLSALQILIRDEMRKVAWALTDEMPDPDEGKELRLEFAEKFDIR